MKKKHVMIVLACAGLLVAAALVESVSRETLKDRTAGEMEASTIIDPSADSTGSGATDLPVLFQKSDSVDFDIDFADPLNPPQEEYAEDIISVTEAYLKASYDGRGMEATQHLAESTFEFFDHLKRDATYARKDALLTRPSIVVILVSSMRWAITPDLLGLKGKELVASIMGNGKSNNSVIKALGSSDLKLRKLRRQDTHVMAQFTYKDSKDITLAYELENGSWKLDVTSLMFAVNEYLDIEIKRVMVSESLSRENVLEELVRAHAQSKDVSDFVIWTPLVARKDINGAQYIRMASFRDPQQGYSIDYPEDWDSVSEDGFQYFLAPSMSDKGIRGSVVTSVSWQSSQSLEEFVDVLRASRMQEAAETGNGWTMVSKTPITFKGFPAYEIVTTQFRKYEGDDNLYPQKAIMILYMKGNNLSYMEYKNNPEDYDNFKPIADRMMQSFVAD